MRNGESLRSPSPSLLRYGLRPTRDRPPIEGGEPRGKLPVDGANGGCAFQIRATTRLGVVEALGAKPGG